MSAAVLSNHILPHRFFMMKLRSPPPKSFTLTIFHSKRRLQNRLQCRARKCNFRIASCLPSSSSSSSKTRFNPSTRLYVSGLSFRTTEESLRNGFKNFGELVEVNLVMDNIAKRPRGFAFIRYASEEEAKKAIEGMHGKFLDGRVIFVEVAKSRADLRKEFNQKPR